jgi:GT2 family glycosyltransferase
VLFAPREPTPLPPDVQQDPGPYTEWVTARASERVAASATQAPGAARDALPHLCLVLIAPGASSEQVRQTLRSLAEQTVDSWTLTIATTTADRDDMRSAVRALPRSLRRRVSVATAEGRQVAHDVWAAAHGKVAGSALALVFPGDRWAPDTVDQLQRALGRDRLVYADEDVLQADGTHAAPRLKPEYSPEFLLSSGYIGRPLAVGAALSEALQGLVSTTPEELELECALRAAEVAGDVVHVPEVLCHRAVPLDQVGGPASRRPVREALRRRGVTAAVVTVPGTGLQTVLPSAPVTTPVSILIPFRDEPQLLRTCVDSVLATVRGVHARCELVLIDNGSTDPEILTLLERYSADPDIVVISDPRPFNWAELNNAGVAAASGEVLVFLNNDIEARQAGWLWPLCGRVLTPDVAAAGARLVYPDGRLQHCGLVVGLGGAAGHVLAGLAPDSPGYLHMAASARECSAVTGACLATRREVFDLLGGFDEALGVNLNDVDYCLRAAAKGYRTLYEPAAELVHHESPSRGTAGGVGDVARFVERWKDAIEARDPYLNVHLTRADPSCGLASPGERDDWERWHATVREQQP